MTEQLNLRIAEKTIAAINERDVKKYMEQFSERLSARPKSSPSPYAAAKEPGNISKP